MTGTFRRALYGFYENELVNNILTFWLPRCVDQEYGGYFNCFNNAGTELVSTDKYAWSQGRFVWLLSKLSMLESPTFFTKQKERFLELAGAGASFLQTHCLVGRDDWRCAFLLDRKGQPKHVDGYDELDLSVYADCFVVAGLALYAVASGSQESFSFALTLYNSVKMRIRSGKYNTLPYPLSYGFRAHGIPMIMTNVATELHKASIVFRPDLCGEMLSDIREYTSDILTNFLDHSFTIREVISSNRGHLDNLLGQHANPGHTLECMWFLMEASDLLNDASMAEYSAKIALRVLEIGWDYEYGGLLHFCAASGGSPNELLVEHPHEPTVVNVLAGWGDKLWWVHSEALYTTLLMYLRTGDPNFLSWHNKVFDYTFSHFSNPNREVREWVQILNRDGSPINKTVALPVKDPYHIVRNLALILEVLSAEKEEVL